MGIGVCSGGDNAIRTFMIDDCSKKDKLVMMFLILGSYVKIKEERR